MSTSMRGWVECWEEHSEMWWGIIDLSLLAPDNYDLYGSLFGVRNYPHFRAIAVERGLPTDCSEHVKREGTDFENNYGHTYITWKEIQDLDPEEEAEGEQAYWLMQDETGDWVEWGKIHASPPTSPEYRSGKREWFEHNRLHRVRRPKRKDAFDDLAWVGLARLVDVLVDRFGAENVRLVVWFY